MNLDSFNLEHWWKAATAAGVALSVAAVAVQHNALLVIGLGIIAGGIGEWINRPVQQQLVRGAFGGVNGVVTGYPWSPKPFGLVLDVLGVLMIGYGILKVVISA